MRLGEKNRAENTRWSFLRSPRAQTAIRVFRVVFLVAVVSYLIWQLSEIGWLEVWRAMPTTPWFYVLFALLYVSIPFTEAGIYKMLWPIDALKNLPAFFKKRVYNRDVLGYSGEFYFFGWARKNVDVAEIEIAKTIRDNNIISSVASTLIAFVLLAIFLFNGEINVTELLGEYASYILATAIGLLVVIPLLVRFRRHLYSMALGTTFAILGIQCGRLIIGQVLQIAQWAVVMPDVPLRIWLTFAAVSIVVTRIPFISNHSLVFLGVGVELSSIVDISETHVAGMLLVTAVLDRLLNLVVFGLSTLHERRRRMRSSGAVALVPAEDSATPN